MPFRPSSPPRSFASAYFPRITAPPKKFIFFLLGLALAESGGFFALILSSPWKTPLAAAALVLLIIYIPAFIIRRP